MKRSVTLALADNIRRIMAHEGLSQLGLAKRAGISQTGIGYLLNYKDEHDRHPTTQTIEAIANALEVEVWQLMMPNMPLDLLRSKRFAKMIENYRDAPDDGRAQVERIAASEVKYAAAESALKGNRKTGSN